MRTKVTLVLIFLNVALFFFIFKFERNWRTEAASREARRRVLGAEAADIRSLEVTSTAATGTFSLTRNRDTWFLTKPLDWPANPHAASTIVHELQLLEHETAFSVADLSKNGLSLADYGLDKPKITVEFSSSDPVPGGSRPSTKLWIGDTTKDGKRLYILSPDRERVHIVNRSLLDSLSLPLDQLRADTLLSIRVFEARSLSIVQAGNVDPGRTATAPGVRVRIRRDGTRWIFEAPHTARASKTAVELAINKLNALHAKSFPANAPSPATAPALRIGIEGSNNRHETLFIGEAVPAPARPATAATPGATASGAAGTPTTAAPATAAPAPVATNAPAEYYAQLQGRNAVFTVEIPADLMDALRNAQETLRETRILEFDAAAVTKIELASPLQPNVPPITLQRLEPPAGQVAAIAPPWQVVRRAEAGQGPQTLPAERAAIQRLLEQLSLLSAQRFKSDAPSSADLEEWGFNRPLREITLSFSGSAPPLVIRIGTDASRRDYYARLGSATEPSVYQISPDIEADLPLSPIAWRDRAVMEPLPATAKVTAVKLTDLETKQVLFEAAFTPTGEPATPPRDPKALTALVNSLRALRAREFVPGGFAERINAAGDDRPWRFTLETTVALPGAGGIEQTKTTTLFLTERLGGSLQFAGSKELDTVFSLEQPLVDALWTAAYGARDPGPRLETRK